jgi:hypothetical protein
MAPALVADHARAMRSNVASLSPPERVVAPDHLRRGLEGALELRDQRGVLSVYFSAGHGVRPGRHDHAPLDRLVHASRADWPLPNVVALEKRVAGLDRIRLMRSATPGLAVFVGVASGRAVEVPLPVEVTPFTAYDHLAHVRPLLEASQRARPAGVVTASASRLAILEARGRRLVELEVIDLESALRRRRWRRGRPGAPSAPAPQPGPSRDLHARRRDEQLVAAAANLGARVGTEATLRGWDLVVTTGTRRLVAAFSRRFPAWRTPLIEVTAPPKLHDASALAPTVAGEIDAVRGRWTAQLIGDLVEQPDTIWQAQPVLAALQQRRVERLVIAGDLEADTAERLIRHALAGAVAVTIADAGALGPLPVAARPRW